jgi:hypothetical protein
MHHITDSQLHAPLLQLLQELSEQGGHLKHLAAGLATKPRAADEQHIGSCHCNSQRNKYDAQWPAT